MHKNLQKASKTCVYLWIKNKELVFIRVYSWFHLKKQSQLAGLWPEARSTNVEILKRAPWPNTVVRNKPNFSSMENT